MSSKGIIEAAETWKEGDKRQFVMAHALDLLIEVGYQGLTMRGIAAGPPRRPLQPLNKDQRRELEEVIRTMNTAIAGIEGTT